MICTVSRENLRHLSGLVDFLHAQRGADLPDEHPPLHAAAVARRSSRTTPRRRSISCRRWTARTHYPQTGRKLVVGNFANILLAIIAPAARRLMCDISPCGGGRCFFALAPNGDLFPCSEFISLPRFRGGNLFRDDISDVLASEPSSRSRAGKDRGDRALPALRHPAFLRLSVPGRSPRAQRRHAAPGAFCEFYQEQVRYALRLIADGKSDDYLWDDWNRDLREVFRFRALS